MSRLSRAFQGRKALIGYLTFGFPSVAGFEKAFKELEEGGADVIELGVPFSDPIADGPTIQYSSQKALENGVTLRGILAWVRGARRRSETPMVLMTYMNPVLAMGLKSFARAAAAAGVDGVIVPDTIPEEGGPLRAALSSAGLDLVHLISPTTPPARRAWIASLSRGFLYAVSLTGVTGARKFMPPEAMAFIRSLKTLKGVPVAVGFGISNAETARKVAPHADGVIVGSALVNLLKEKKPLLPFVRSLRAALDKK